MNTFYKDKELSDFARPFQNKIYQQIFGKSIGVKRFEKDKSLFILDALFHIDIIIKVENSTIFTGQEKALRQEYSHYNTFTIEFYQNRFTKEKGEFFNLCSQYYLHGYLNGNTINDTTGFEKWYVIKIFDFMYWLKNVPVSELEYTTRPTYNSNANFYYINYNDIPKNCIYTSYLDY